MGCKKFKSNEFAIEMISRGQCIDDIHGMYMIDTIVIRLNPEALNEWIFSRTSNSRGCYSTNEEWEAHKTKYEEKNRIVKNKIINALELDSEKGSICITQSQAEIFTVIQTWMIMQPKIESVTLDSREEL